MHISDLTIRLLQNVSNVIKNRLRLILNNFNGFMLFFPACSNESNTIFQVCHRGWSGHDTDELCSSSCVCWKIHLQGSNKIVLE